MHRRVHEMVADARTARASRVETAHAAGRTPKVGGFAAAGVAAAPRACRWWRSACRGEWLLGGLSVQQAAALTLSPATMGGAGRERGAPRTAGGLGGRGLLPLLEGALRVAQQRRAQRPGWWTSGDDRVLLNADGRRIGYAIASGRAPATNGGSVVRRWGVRVPRAEPRWRNRRDVAAIGPPVRGGRPGRERAHTAGARELGQRAGSLGLSEPPVADRGPLRVPDEYRSYFARAGRSRRGAESVQVSTGERNPIGEESGR